MKIINKTNLNNLINANSLGRKLLINTQPAYLYVDNKRTDTVTGFFYNILLPDAGYERTRVKINGDHPLMECRDGQTIPVEFDNLHANVYVHNNAAAVSFAADGVHPAK